MSCSSIMVVEDDEEIRKSVVRALKSEGYDVLVAENGRVALEKLVLLKPEELPGCMILDLMMPEMDGLTLIERMEKDYKDRFASIKVLIATAKGSTGDGESIPGTYDRLQKPFELGELFRVVEEHCGKPN